MRRAVYLAALTIVIAAGSYSLTRYTELRSQVIGRKPFTATVLHRIVTPAGTVAHTYFRTYAFRTDGSQAEATATETPAGQVVQGRSVVLVPLKEKLGILPETESVTTYPLSRAGVNIYTSWKTTCTDNPNAAHSKVLGYDVVKVVRDHTQPFPVHEEAWLAPALGCFQMRSTSTISSPVGTQWNTYDTLLVIEGEPPGWLFDIPTGYVERSPSQVAAEYARRFPGHFMFGSSTGQHLDQAYSSLRSK